MMSHIGAWLLLLALPLASSEAGLTANVEAYPTLVKCLEAGMYTVNGADGKRYTEARATLSKFFDNFPTAVAYPTSTGEVQHAIRCAKKFAVKVHPRCGNHGNEGETVALGDLTLDLRNMSSITVAPDGQTARVQGGATVGQAIGAIQLATNYTRAFPGGQRPTVGMGGYVLGGGFGALTRAYGLASDNVISVEVVTANGDVIVADSEQYADLLWALRGGGGGNVVVVTEFTVLTADVSMGTVDISFDKLSNTETLQLYNQHLRFLPNRYTMRVDGDFENPGSAPIKPVLILNGLCLGSLEVCRLGLLGVGTPPEAMASAKLTPMSFLDATVANIGWAFPKSYCPDADEPNAAQENKCTAEQKALALMDRDAWPDRAFYKYKSILSDYPVMTGLIAAQFVKFLEQGGAFEYQTLGGAMSAVDPSWTAASNLRTADFLAIMKAPGPQNGQEQNYTVAIDVLSKATSFLETLISEINVVIPSYRYKAYVNFLDTDIPSLANYSYAYYGDTVNTLRCIKAKYDPGNMFRNPLQYGSYDWPLPSESKCKKLKEAAKLGSRKMGKVIDQALATGTGLIRPPLEPLEPVS